MSLKLNWSVTLVALVLAASAAAASIEGQTAILRWECVALDSAGEVAWSHDGVAHSTRAGAEAFARLKAVEAQGAGTYDIACGSRLAALAYAPKHRHPYADVHEHPYSWEGHVHDYASAGHSHDVPRVRSWTCFVSKTGERVGATVEVPAFDEAGAERNALEHRLGRGLFDRREDIAVGCSPS